MRRFVSLILACLVGACTDTLIGPFIERTHEVRSDADLAALGFSFVPGHANNPAAVCAENYDREFAPWGEHYQAENWRTLSRNFTFDRDLEAIIDVNTGRHDFGQVALVWRENGERLKLFMPGMATLPQLPDGCFRFSDLHIDETLEPGRLRQSRAPYALTD